jgi:uncharacterized protein YkwD
LVLKAPTHPVTVIFLAASPSHCRFFLSPQFTDVSGYFLVLKAPTHPVTVIFVTASPSHCRFFLSPHLTDV